MPHEFQLQHFFTKARNGTCSYETDKLFGNQTAAINTVVCCNNHARIPAQTETERQTERQRDKQRERVCDRWVR